MDTILNHQRVGVKESVSDELLLLNPLQTPLLSALGFAEPVTNTTHEWFEDHMIADKTTVTTAADASATTLSVADGAVFVPNTVAKVGEELVLVTAVAGNDVTVTRGYAGTTAGAIAKDAKIEFQFVEGVEGADARKARYKAREAVTNITQIFDETISISGTAAAVSEHGIEDLYEYEKQKKQEELASRVEKAAFNGIKYNSPDGKVRQMGGIRQFIKTNVIDGGGNAVTLDKLTDAFQAIFEAGGFKSGGNYKIVVGAKQKRAISKIDVDKVNIARQDNGRGQVVDHFLSDFGAAEIVLNNNIESDEIFIVDYDRIKIKPLKGRDFTHQYLGVKGDYVEGQIVGEYTLQVKQEDAHARIKNLA